jgi:hypothetical protein
MAQRPRSRRSSARRGSDARPAWLQHDLRRQSGAVTAQQFPADLERSAGPRPDQMIFFRMDEEICSNTITTTRITRMMAAA